MSGKSRSSDVIQNELSVVIPLYNKEETIIRTLESISRQIFLPKEVIVVDDGSTDRGIDEIEEYSADDINVRVIEQKNSGVAFARNRGVKAATTKYVCFLDADDEWLPEFTRNLKDLIQLAPDAQFYSLPYFIKSGDKTIIPKVDLPDEFAGIITNFIQTYSNGYGLICSSVVCFKREFFLKLGGFPNGIQSGEDIYLWLHSGLKGEGAFLNKRSAIVYKDADLSRNRRTKSKPYYLEYFTNHLFEFDEQQQKYLRQFMLKNIFILWTVSKIEKNRWQRELLRSYCKKLSPVRSIILYVAEVLPVKFFSYLKKKRDNNRAV